MGKRTFEEMRPGKIDHLGKPFWPLWQMWQGDQVDVEPCWECGTPTRWRTVNGFAICSPECLWSSQSPKGEGEE